MINSRFKTARQVVLWRLCMGCGACIFACEDNNIKLVDVPEQGLRPEVDIASCKQCGKCVQVCPGVRFTSPKSNGRAIPELLRSWGPVLEVWQGYAADSEIRFKGSSGGLVTALALYCQEKEHLSRVLHIGGDPSRPWRNKSVISHNRSELLANAGSRYSPAAPCEKVSCILEADSRCVFIGKPCDVEALSKLQEAKPALRDKIGLTVSIFCAGTPSANGTKAMLEFMGLRQDEVTEIRYRGYGWPGMTSVKHRGNEQLYQLTYEQSWGDILSHYVPLRCRLCPDGTGELADISCGDPWYRHGQPNDPGQSLVLVRTERGHKFLHRALESGYVRLTRTESKSVPLSQKSLLNKRRNLWGRLLAMRMMRIPTPHFGGFSLFANWCRLSVYEQICSVAGTFYRVISRKLNRPLERCFK